MHDIYEKEAIDDVIAMIKMHKRNIRKSYSCMPDVSLYNKHKRTNPLAKEQCEEQVRNSVNYVANKIVDKATRYIYPYYGLTTILYDHAFHKDHNVGIISSSLMQ